jgi:hypothetical protein
MFRCLLLNASYGPERYPESPAAATKDCYLEPPREGDVDRPRARRWINLASLIILLVLLTALILGIVASSAYADGADNESKAQRTYILRYNQALPLPIDAR